jgi:hypothetical protein
MTSAAPSTPGTQGEKYASVQANRARFSVAVPSTASFDRLLPAAKAISLAQAGLRCDRCPKSPGIWRMSGKESLAPAIADAYGRLENIQLGRAPA